MSAAPIRVKVRAQASMHFPGWEARARLAGVRLTAAPAAFGRLSYIAKMGHAAVAFESARGEEMDWTMPSSAAALVLALESAGIVYRRPDGRFP